MSTDSYTFAYTEMLEVPVASELPHSHEDVRASLLVWRADLTDLEDETLEQIMEAYSLGQQRIDHLPLSDGSRDAVDFARRRFIDFCDPTQKTTEIVVAASPNKRPPMPGAIVEVGTMAGLLRTNPRQTLQKMPTFASQTPGSIKKVVENGIAEFGFKLTKAMFADAPAALKYPDRARQVIQVLRELGCEAMLPGSPEILDWQPEVAKTRLQEIQSLGYSISDISRTCGRVLLNKPGVLRRKKAVTEYAITKLCAENSDLAEEFIKAAEQTPDIILKISTKRIKHIARVIGSRATFEDFKQFSAEVSYRKAGRGGVDVNPVSALLRILSKTPPATLESAPIGENILTYARNVLNDRQRQLRNRTVESTTAL